MIHQDGPSTKFEHIPILCKAYDTTMAFKETSRWSRFRALFGCVFEQL